MDKASTSKSDDSETNTDCSVCLQPFVQPVKLPCDHVFCFLCAKGLVQQSKKCALCRKDIPSNYINMPQFVVQKPSRSKSDSCQWYYKGNSGWWQYDDQTSGQIEHAYQNDEERCELLIAGQIYIVDFEKNKQILKSNPIRSRHIKRDLDTIPCKGVAGVRASLSCKTSFQKNNDTVKTASPAKSSESSGCSIIISKADVPTICVNVVASSLQNVPIPSSSNSSCSTTGNLSNTNDPKTLILCAEVDRPLLSEPSMNVKDDLSKFVNSVQKQPTIKNTEQEMNESQPLHIHKSNKLQNTAVDYSEKQLPKRSWTDTKEQNENEDHSSDPSPSTKRVKCSNLECIQQNLKNSFGAMVVSKLQEMSQVQKLYAEKIINDALFDGLLGKLSENSCISS